MYVTEVRKAVYSICSITEVTKAMDTISSYDRRRVDRGHYVLNVSDVRILYLNITDDYEFSVVVLQAKGRRCHRHKKDKRYYHRHRLKQGSGHCLLTSQSFEKSRKKTSLAFAELDEIQTQFLRGI